MEKKKKTSSVNALREIPQREKERKGGKLGLTLHLHVQFPERNRREKRGGVGSSMSCRGGKRVKRSKCAKFCLPTQAFWEGGKRSSKKRGSAMRSKKRGKVSSSTSP